MKTLIALVVWSFAFRAHAVRDNFDMIDGKDYYQFFEIAVDADAGTIKSAYRKLMKRYHTDGGSQKDLEISKKINNVNDVLSDSTARQRYDLWRTTGMQGNGSSGEWGSHNNPKDEAVRRDVELKKTATDVIREAEKIRAQYPSATFDQVADQGRFFVIHFIRYMPGAYYTTQDLWRLFSEFGMDAYENGRISEDAFVMLSGGALQYLKDYGGFGDEESYLIAAKELLLGKLNASRYDRKKREVWDVFWKIINNGQSYYSLPPSNCEASLTQSVQYTKDGVLYEIPVTVSIKLGM